MNVLGARKRCFSARQESLILILIFANDVPFVWSTSCNTAESGSWLYTVTDSIPVNSVVVCVCRPLRSSHESLEIVQPIAATIVTRAKQTLLVLRFTNFLKNIKNWIFFTLYIAVCTFLLLYLFFLILNSNKMIPISPNTIAPSIAPPCWASLSNSPKLPIQVTAESNSKITLASLKSKPANFKATINHFQNTNGHTQMCRLLDHQKSQLY